MAGTGETCNCDDSRSFDALLRCVAACLPDDLIGVEATERLALCGSTLPVSAAQSMFGFEMRLDDTAPLCDFFLDVPRDVPVSTYLIAQGRSRQAGAVARGLSRLLQELERRDSFLSRWFERVILEYDLVDGGNRASLVPGVFLPPAEPETETLPDGVPPYQLANPGVLVAAMCATVNWPEEKEELRTVFRMVDVLPAGARVAHIGVLPVRKARAIRFLLRMPAEQVMEFLDRIEWQGPCAEVARALSLAAPGFSRLTLGLDVTGGTFSPRIGFELHFDRPWQELASEDCDDFISLCEAEGWCVAAKARRLRNWPRMQYLIHDREFVPLLSGLNHFKLVVHNREISVKAYAGAKLLL